MADFNKYKPLLKQLEGGWSDDPSDPGGKTMCGVTLDTYRKFYGQERTADELRHIPDEQWSRIMKTYWDNVKGDMIENQSIAEMVADWHINAGTRAIKEMQRKLMLTPDGIVGPLTLAVLNSPNREVIFNRIKECRESYYRHLAMNNLSLYKFLNGWLSRVHKINFSES